jgi:hypothetical protein
LLWDSDHDVPDKKFKMTLAQKAKIASWIKEVDRAGKINRYNIGLYEKFCLGKV